jgi:hypothetical protein
MQATDHRLCNQRPKETANIKQQTANIKQQTGEMTYQFKYKCVQLKLQSKIRNPILKLYFPTLINNYTYLGSRGFEPLYVKCKFTAKTNSANSLYYHPLLRSAKQRSIFFKEWRCFALKGYAVKVNG